MTPPPHLEALLKLAAAINADRRNPPPAGLKITTPDGEWSIEWLRP